MNPPCEVDSNGQITIRFQAPATYYVTSWISVPHVHLRLCSNDAASGVTPILKNQSLSLQDGYSETDQGHLRAYHTRCHCLHSGRPRTRRWRGGRGGSEHVCNGAKKVNSLHLISVLLRTWRDMSSTPLSEY